MNILTSSLNKNRFGHLDDSNEEIKIEINLQKVRVMTVPDWDEHSETEVIQFSKYDTVNDLYSRLIDTDPKYISHRLLKVTCDKEWIFNAIQNYKDYYKNGGELNYQIDEILPSDDCVMSLALDDHILLIVENIKSCEVKIRYPLLETPKKIQTNEKWKIKQMGNFCLINLHINFYIFLIFKEIKLYLSFKY